MEGWVSGSDAVCLCPVSAQLPLAGNQCLSDMAGMFIFLLLGKMKTLRHVSAVKAEIQAGH